MELLLTTFLTVWAVILLMPSLGYLAFAKGFDHEVFSGIFSRTALILTAAAAWLIAWLITWWIC